MQQCCVIGCRNKKDLRKTAGISFHRVPKDEVQRVRWIKAIGRQRDEITEHSLVCSVHFREEDLDKTSPFRVYLRRDAVPSIFYNPAPAPMKILKVKSFAKLNAMDMDTSDSAAQMADSSDQQENQADMSIDISDISYNNDSQEHQEENAEDSDVCTLTLTDVLQIQNNLIEDTAAVLGASSDKTCSYGEGYLKRQALYSCLTCIPEAKTDPEKRTGVCLACSYHCHDGHDLVELYTKRNFRCDCGNSKFNGFKCNLMPDKSDINELNTYNQNFSGVYCVCHRPYPDAEDPLPDEMIQCIICEDWYHSRHLGVPLPADSFAEMICESCVRQHEFLLNYDERCPGKSEDEVVNIDGLDEPLKDPLETGAEADADLTSDLEMCKKPKKKSEEASARFMHDLAWRKTLCKCSECMQMYAEEGVLFLIDPEDPVHLYEELGKAKAKEVIENHDRKLMNSVNRVQLMEAIAGYNELKESLAEYLKKFAENKKIVKEEDIKEFFEGMKARKKQKTDIPYFCR